MYESDEALLENTEEKKKEKCCADPESLNNAREIRSRH